MSVPHSVMKCIQWYNYLQVPAESEQPHFVWKLTLELEVMCWSSMYSNIFYPNQISPAGLPTGLDHVSTRLTAYNGSHIPLYGALNGPITWQPGGPGTWPHKVHSYWYVHRHPWPCHHRSPIMQKVSSYEDELCHQSCPTWYQTSKPCTCSHSNSSQVHQIHWWID